ncbi:flagellar assembly protein FliW [Paenibacillus sp. LjRoot153]|uniref:flagellar assembly protein FliW n=1 Tax=Paenibacillus sp. LjRoot153 TaxID=3342270 RepID=UPI003ECE5A97
MNITTLQFGELTIAEHEVFTFPQGIPGFEQNVRYIFIQPDVESPFIFLQCVDNGNLALLLTNPFEFFPDYDMELSDSVVIELGIESKEDVAVWTVVSVGEQLEEATLNLLAPIIVNVNTRLGKQVILHGSSYNAKHKLMQSVPSDNK